jgi:mannosyltransferase OCH1-like enzyme
LPMFGKASAANIKLLNPDFEYICFDDEGMERFVRENFMNYLGVFKSFDKPIQKYDFFRYLAVYKLGGFYFDMDVFLASSLSDLLAQSCVFPFECISINKFMKKEYGMDWEVGNYAFGSAPHHPFMKAVIENCIRAKENENWAKEMLQCFPRPFRDEFSVIYTTGPGLVSRTLGEYRDTPRVTVLFPENVCDIASWRHFGPYGVHLMMSTWRKRQSFFRRRMLNWWWGQEERKAIRAAEMLGGSRSLDVLRNA